MRLQASALLLGLFDLGACILVAGLDRLPPTGDGAPILDGNAERRADGKQETGGPQCDLQQLIHNQVVGQDPLAV